LRYEVCFSNTFKRFKSEGWSFKMLCIESLVDSLERGIVAPRILIKRNESTLILSFFVSKLFRSKLRVLEKIKKASSE